MEWKEIRAHYARLFGAAKAESGATQTSVAAAAGLRQNAISKLIANRNQGPSVETFVKAVFALGLPVSEFFRQVERQSGQALIKVAESKVPYLVDQAFEKIRSRPHTRIDDDEETRLALEIGREVLRQIRLVVDFDRRRKR